MIRHVFAAACMLAAAPGRAQLAGPALHQGDELTVSLTQQAFESSFVANGSGVAGTYRHVGRVNFAARYASATGDGTSLEVGSFGIIATLPGRVALGCAGGLAYSSGHAGIHAPVGLTASRVIHLGALIVAPFAEGRIMVQQLDQPSLDAGRFTSYAELGAQVQMLDDWSVRASTSASSNSAGFGVGIARRL